MPIPLWNGTPTELVRLAQALERHCGCALPVEVPGPACPAHALLTRQASLDHLLFVYRARSRLLAGEFQAD